MDEDEVSKEIYIIVMHTHMHMHQAKPEAGSVYSAPMPRLMCRHRSSSSTPSKTLNLTFMHIHPCDRHHTHSPVRSPETSTSTSIFTSISTSLLPSPSFHICPHHISLSPTPTLVLTLLLSLSLTITITITIFRYDTWQAGAIVGVKCPNNDPNE